jgi:peptidylprolyl isomerase
MFRTYELVGMFVASFLLLIGVWLMQIDQSFTALVSEAPSQVATPGMIVAGGDSGETIEQVVRRSIEEDGDIQNLIVDNIKEGTGAPVEMGDTVTVHYVGTLPSGEEFDNSRVRGEPLTFTLGAGNVIPGWEKGIRGMREGGERILIIPSRLAYGDAAAGSIPADATLIFSVEVLSVE